MDVVIETIQIIHNYPLGSEGFGYWVSLHLEVIIDPGEIRSWLKKSQLVKKILLHLTSNWSKILIKLVSYGKLFCRWGSSTSNMEQKCKLIYTNK